MASGVNKITLLGNLGAVVELKYTPGGKAYAAGNLATNESYKDKDGVWKDVTEWHRVVFWGRVAENVAAHTKKGTQLYLEGKMRSRSYKAKCESCSGEVTKYASEVNVLFVKILNGGVFESGKSDDAAASTQITDEDIPF